MSYITCMSFSYSSAIEEIKARCNIVDVISSAVPLKRAGVNYKGCCPFHNEKTPSFIVSESKQIFTCFGCGATGDVIEFEKRFYGLTFPEAVQRLAKELGIEIEDSYSEKAQAKDPYFEVNRMAARFFYNAIKEGPNAGYTYLAKRGIKPETIQKFGMGWADDKWSSLTDYLIAKKCDPKMLVDLGLSSKSQKGRIYDKFRSRVIFPIINTRGKVIGFGGRIVGEGEPKYLNSPESTIFQKKYNLFGLNLSRTEIQSEGYAIIVEGYMDVVSLYQAGIKNVCASLGTALTEEQAKLLKRYTEKVILCYDADSAGIQAALRGIDILRAAGLDVRVLHVDDGKDPDEYIQKHGPDEFRNLAMNKAVGDIDYKIALIRKKYDINDTRQGVQFLKAVSEVLRKLSPVEAELYIKKIAQEYSISEGALRREINNTPEKKQLREKLEKNAEEKPRSESSLLMEKTLIRLSLLKSDYFLTLKDYTEAFVSIPGNAIYSVMLSQYQEDTDFDPAKIKDALDENAAAYLDGLLKEIKVGDDSKAFADCIAKLNKARTEKRKKEITDILDLLDSEADSEYQKKLMEEYMQLCNRKR